MRLIFFKERFMNIAHRGGAGLFPENTLYAFTHVLKFLPDALEMDIRSSKDEHLVVHHDETVERTTNGRGHINKMTLSEIKNLDAGYNFTLDGETFPMRGKGLTIPTLEEIFQVIKDVPMNIDIKQSYPPIEKKLYALINRYDMADLVLVATHDELIRKKFASFNKASIATSASFCQVLPFYFAIQLGLGFLYNPNTSVFQIPLKTGKIQVINKHFIEEAHKKDILVHAWTINKKDSMKQLIKMGVNGIITDYPDRLQEVLLELEM